MDEILTQLDSNLETLLCRVRDMRRHGVRICSDETYPHVESYLKHKTEKIFEVLDYYKERHPH